MEDYQDHAELLKVLADPVRLEMIKTIAEGETACLQFEDQLALSKSTISYHIKQLRLAKMIKIRKEGRYYFYSLVPETFDNLLPDFLASLTERSKEAAETGA